MPSVLESDRFPRSNAYNPDWVMASPMGANPLWLAEWLGERLHLRPGERILDLGCGKAKSSIFLAREYGVQVWATDLWTHASENQRRILDADLGDAVFPIHADARNLPFAAGFFDVVVCIDSYNYFGTDDTYLNYLTRFLRPRGRFAFASAGLMQELEGPPPQHLRKFWTQDCWTIHTARWWRDHLQKTGLVSVDLAEAIDDGWRLWLKWAQATNTSDWYREMLATDAGRYLGYVAVTATRTEQQNLAQDAWPSTLRSLPSDYVKHALLRTLAQPSSD